MGENFRFQRTVGFCLIVSCSVFFSLGSVPFSYANGTEFSLPPEVAIPTNLGTIDSIHWSLTPQSQSPAVYYIQDAHNSLEAQKNIASLIGYLAQKTGAKTLLVEGYEGPLPLDELFDIKNSEAKEKVSSFFMDYLRLSGAQYAYINRSQDFEIIGIENLNNYRANLTAYQRAAKDRGAVQEGLDIISKNLSILSDRVYPKEIKDFIKWHTRFANKQLGIGDYVFRLMKLTAAVDSQPQYPHLSIVSQYLAKTHLTEKESKELSEQLRKIDSKVFFDELKALERKIIQTHLKNPVAKQTYQYQRSLELLVKLNSFSLAPEEWQELHKKRGEKYGLETQTLAQFLAFYLKQPVMLSNLWETLIQNQLDFYRLALERENNFRDKIRDFRRQSPDTVPIILVTGGFHKSGITQFLESEKMSYAVISPRITRPDPVHEKRYDFLMAGQYYPFEKPFYFSATAAQQPTVANLPKDETRSLVKTAEQSLSEKNEINPRTILTVLKNKDESLSVQPTLSATAGEPVSPPDWDRLIKEQPRKNPLKRTALISLMLAALLGGAWLTWDIATPLSTDKTLASRRFPVYATGDTLIVNNTYQLELKNRDPMRRRDAVGNLRNQNSAQALQYLLKGLEDAEWNIRADAVKYLGFRSAPDILEALIKIAEGDPQDEVRAMAIFYLSQKDGENIQQLLQKALTDPSQYVRGFAAEKLRKLQNPQAGPLWEEIKANPQQFIQDIKTSKNPHLKFLAANLLGVIGTKEATAALKEALDTNDIDSPLPANLENEFLIAVAQALKAPEYPIAYLVLFSGIEDYNRHEIEKKALREAITDPRTGKIMGTDIPHEQFQRFCQNHPNGKIMFQERYLRILFRNHPSLQLETPNQKLNVDYIMRDDPLRNHFLKEQAALFLSNESTVGLNLRIHSARYPLLTLWSILALFVIVPPLLSLLAYNLIAAIRGASLIRTHVPWTILIDQAISSSVRLLNPKGHWIQWLETQGLIGSSSALLAVGVLGYLGAGFPFSLIAVPYLLSFLYYYVFGASHSLLLGEKGIKKIKDGSYNFFDLIAIIEDPAVEQHVKSLPEPAKKVLLSALEELLPRIRDKEFFRLSNQWHKKKTKEIITLLKSPVAVIPQKVGMKSDEKEAAGKSLGTHFDLTRKKVVITTDEKGLREKVFRDFPAIFRTSPIAVVSWQEFSENYSLEQKRETEKLFLNGLKIIFITDASSEISGVFLRNTANFHAVRGPLQAHDLKTLSGWIGKNKILYISKLATSAKKLSEPLGQYRDQALYLKQPAEQEGILTLGLYHLLADDYQDSLRLDGQGFWVPTEFGALILSFVQTLLQSQIIAKAA